MNRHILLAFLLWIGFSPALAENSSYEATAKKYLNALNKTHTPLFLGACKTDDGVAIVVFPIGRELGMLLEVQQDSVVDLAPLRVKGKTVSLDVANAQGGLYTYVVMQNHAEDAIKGPFHLLAVESLDHLMRTKPSSDCPDRPPQYK